MNSVGSRRFVILRSEARKPAIPGRLVILRSEATKDLPWLSETESRSFAALRMTGEKREG